MAQQCTLDELQGKLATVTAALTLDMVRPLMPAVRVMALGDQRRRFDTATTPEGIPWAPLAHPRPNGGGLVLRDFGALAASITAKTTDDTVIVGTNLKYAPVHFFGKVILPTGGRKFIAIPLTVEAKRWGSPRFPRPFPRRLFPMIRTGANKGILAEMQGGRVIAQYALVPSVTIPSRVFMGYSAEFREDLFMLWGETLVEAVRPLTGGP